MYQSRKDDPLRGLDHGTRSRIRRAVRRGVAVHDPREAPMAAAYADVVAARENPIPFGLPVLFAVFGVGTAAVVLGVIPPVILLPLAVAVLARPIQARIVERAERSSAANRELASQTGVHDPRPEAPKREWQDVGAWSVAVFVVLLLGAHLIVRAQL